MQLQRIFVIVQCIKQDICNTLRIVSKVQGTMLVYIEI